MLEALSAEALKMRTHKATWFLVWLFPIACTIIMLLIIGARMTGIEPPEHQAAADWMEDTALIWFVPNNAVGRYLLSAFIAVMFAGEYGWNTWKLIVPHRRRTSLIAAKYALTLILFAASFVLTAAITTGLSFADMALSGEPIADGVTAAALWDMHSRTALAAVAPVLVTIAYASLAGILSRSTIAALVVAIVATTIEQIIVGFGPQLYVKFPSIVWPLYHALPGHHIANLAEFIREGSALKRAFPGGLTVELYWTTSLAVLVAWIAALWGATFAAFSRQDIN
ncbi:MAG TPA: ABC transporter permease [Allosphingosinicella sp.]|jgi:ABC-type transport system involved in multi-copper enzyme maturation permease subunit|nr:ABC transporter permease [Allosphingosinicella sp.]